MGGTLEGQQQVFRMADQHPGQGGSDRVVDVIVRDVSLATEGGQIRSGLLDGGNTAVLQAKCQVTVSPVGARVGETQVSQQPPRGVKGGIIRTADGRTPVCLFVHGCEPLAGSQEVMLCYCHEYVTNEKT